MLLLCGQLCRFVVVVVQRLLSSFNFLCALYWRRPRVVHTGGAWGSVWGCSLQALPLSLLLQQKHTIVWVGRVHSCTAFLFLGDILGWPSDVRVCLEHAATNAKGPCMSACVAPLCCKYTHAWDAQRAPCLCKKSAVRYIFHCVTKGLFFYFFVSLARGACFFLGVAKLGSAVRCMLVPPRMRALLSRRM